MTEFAQAVALGRAGRHDEALALLARAPASLPVLSLRAAMLVQLRRFEAADAAFRAAIALAPDDRGAWLNHGHLLKTVGGIDEAIAAYRRAIALAPERGNGWWAIANLRPAALDAADIAAMRVALGEAGADGDRLQLHFALGKALDRGGDVDAAFGHLAAGNALHRAQAPYDAARASAAIRRDEALLTPDLLAPRTPASAGGPIFVLGLPRSGSSLVEQILASHPLVEGAGELHDLHAVMQAAGGLARVAALPPVARAALGERYLAATRRRRAGDRPFFTDKMPSNWIYAGAIPLILPGARIVDVRRHAMACGFANFTQLYARGNDFAYDLADIGRFTVDYLRHMALIDAVAPELVHRVHHERLVEDPEAEIRRLLARLGLPFDAACLRFHETARAVDTPSTDQVRRPINRDGVDRWRAYAAHLKPLREALGDEARA